VTRWGKGHRHSHTTLTHVQPWPRALPRANACWPSPAAARSRRRPCARRSALWAWSRRVTAFPRGWAGCPSRTPRGDRRGCEGSAREGRAPGARCSSTGHGRRCGGRGRNPIGGAHGYGGCSSVEAGTARRWRWRIRMRGSSGPDCVGAASRVRARVKAADKSPRGERHGGDEPQARSAIKGWATKGFNESKTSYETEVEGARGS